MKLSLACAAAVLAGGVAFGVSHSHAASREAAIPPPPVARAPMDIWPGLAPGETTASTGTVQPDQSKYGPITKISEITRPQMIFCRAPGPSKPRPTVVILPGGGYYVVTEDIEGMEIARWLNGLGYNAVILNYRVPNWQVQSPQRREPAFADAQKAMTLLRGDAAKYGIDPKHLGVIGFSAGGHLAARLATHAATPDARPDFALLVYPAYLWDKDKDAAAPEVQPTAGTPPMFLMQTRDDDLFDVEPYAKALTAAGVANRCFAYDKGGHGYGLRLAKDLPASHWPDEAAAWLKAQVAK